ncbi:MAG: hypothetical protein NVS1B11_36290 [Terriglobales bacterium]
MIDDKTKQDDKAKAEKEARDKEPKKRPIHEVVNDSVQLALQHIAKHGHDFADRAVELSDEFQDVLHPDAPKPEIETEMTPRQIADQETDKRKHEAEVHRMEAEEKAKHAHKHAEESKPSTGGSVKQPEGKK